MTDSANTNLVARPPTGALARSDIWRILTPEARRRRATEAARDRDTAELWSLTDAHLTLHGARGVLTSKHTRRAYKAAVQRLIAAWAGESILRPSRDAATAYVRALEVRYARPTVVQHVSAGRSLYKALRWSGATDADPFRDLKVQVPDKEEHTKRDAFTEPEVGDLLAAAEAVDKVLILLCARGGLRVAEALALTWDAVDLRGEELHLTKTKGGRARDVDLTRDLAEALAAWRPHAPKDRVLPYGSGSRARQRLAAVQARANVQAKPGRLCHALRHTCGVSVFKASGHDLTVAQHWLGHADPSTTRSYLGRVERERRRAVAALIPRLPVLMRAQPHAA